MAPTKNLEVLNDHGSITINSEYENYVFSRKLTNIPGIESKDYDKDKKILNKFVVLHGRGYGWGVTEEGMMASLKLENLPDTLYAVTTLASIERNDIVISKITQNTTSKYTEYVFGYPRYSPKSLDTPAEVLIKDLQKFVAVYVFNKDYKKANYGLEVYNENGQLIFSSANKYLRILDMVIGNLPGSGKKTNVINSLDWGNHYYQLTSKKGYLKKTIAVMAFCTPDYTTLDGQQFSTHVYEGFKLYSFAAGPLIGSNYRRDAVFRPGLGRLSASNDCYQYQALIVDVTGY